MPRSIPLLLPALLFLAAALPAHAQKFQPKNIHFIGVPEYSDRDLAAAASLKPGMLLNIADMGDHAKQLMETGLFATMNYRFEGTDIVCTLTPAELLFPLRMQNLPLATGPDLDAKLRSRFPLYHGKVPPEGGMLDNVRIALQEILAAQGIKATVAAMPWTDMALHKVTAMSFNITDPPVLVGDLRLDSASPALDPKAQEILAKQSGSPYDVEGSPSAISVNVSNFYRDKGYLEATIQATPQLSPAVSPEAVRIPFAISFAPGPLYKIGTVQLAPGLVVTQADFDHQAGIHPGDIADRARIGQNWSYLSRQYHNHGYMKAEIHPTPTFDRTQNLVAYTVNVTPGLLYTMGKLRIDNVSDDLRAAMLAAWKMPPGTSFNESSVLGFFTIGDINPALKRVFAAANCKYFFTLNDEDHTVDVVLKLEKRT
jgi:outer membrane protein assembly factor BamA